MKINNQGTAPPERSFDVYKKNKEAVRPLPTEKAQTNKSDKIELSPEARELRKLLNKNQPQFIREELVQKLRGLIEKGEYRVPAEKIAEKIIEEIFSERGGRTQNNE